MNEIKKIGTSNKLSKLNINMGLKSNKNSSKINANQPVEEVWVIGDRPPNDRVPNREPNRTPTRASEHVPLSDEMVLRAKYLIPILQKGDYHYKAAKSKTYITPILESEGESEHPTASCSTFVNEVLYWSGVCKAGERWYTAGSDVKNRLKDRGISYTVHETDNDPPRPGDIFHKKNWSHCGIVTAVNGNEIEICEVNNNGNKDCAEYNTIRWKEKGMHFIRINGKQMEDGSKGD